MTTAARPRLNRDRGHRINVVVVEEQQIVRRGLLAALAEDDNFQVTTATDIGVIADDVDVAVVSRGVARRDGFPCPIVVCSDDPQHALHAASGSDIVAVLDRDTVTVAQLQATVYAAAVGLRIDADVDSSALPPLESRSRLVLELLAEGYTTREIAARMSYSERTIKNVITVLQARLQTRSRVQTVAEAIRRGLI
jgi:DNA-binding NarL/FixJ family response regulator